VRTLSRALLGGGMAYVAVTTARRAQAPRARRQANGRVREGAISTALAEHGRARGHAAIVMSALNEAESIGDVLAEIPATVCGLPTTIVVVDDGSTDKTAEIARDAGAVVASHARNLGQGDGLRTGFALAQELGAAVVVTMDADGQHNPAEIESLVRPVVDDLADYVQGSRFLGQYDDAGGARHAGIKGFTTLINLVSGAGITDCTNGFRAVRASSLATMRLVEDRFSASEIIIQASARGLRMREVPVHIRSRAAGESRKPRGLGYPLGYGATIGRSAVRAKLAGRG
jgi:glycosyltransferase involved in cell wall biosynthesis